VHLVGYFRSCVTMHGFMNVKLINNFCQHISVVLPFHISFVFLPFLLCSSPPPFLVSFSECCVPFLSEYLRLWCFYGCTSYFVQHQLMEMWQLRDIRLESSYAYHKSHVAWLIVLLVGSLYVNVPAWEYLDCNLSRIFDSLVVDLSHFPPLVLFKDGL
jgi:hypothetical protein